MKLDAWRPHAAVAGYALFLVIYATQVWGGVFPFLPADFQTDEVTLSFYLSQSLAFCAAFVASAFGSYYLPSGARRMFVALPCALAFLGATSVIAAMYVPALTLAFVVGGGAFLGVGCAGLFMLWQRYFSSIPADECNARIVMGTAAASVLYFALYLIPQALTAFLVPVVMLPLCALCLSLSVREMDFDQPMFQDVPRKHAYAYAHVVKDSWRSAACVGALAFAAGLARGVAVIDPEVQSVVNASSMAGALVMCALLVAAWARLSFRFSLRTAFRAAYPVVVTGLVLFPFAQGGGLSLFAGLTYTVFSLIVVIMMMQSAQIARDRGTNPVFAYAFFGSFAYVPQAAGFLLGWFAHDVEIGGVGQVALLSIVALYVLGIVLFLSAGSLLGAPRDGAPRHDDQIELVGFAPRRSGSRADAYARAKPRANNDDVAAMAGGGAMAAKTGGEKPGDGDEVAPARRPRKKTPIEAADGRAITDRLSKQCLVLQREYGLSARETEVCELIARGLSVAAIAEELYVSENTVRTHSKHIYTKLDIHSRQELGELVKNTEL